jgi:hypothetical protein
VDGVTHREKHGREINHFSRCSPGDQLASAVPSIASKQKSLLGTPAGFFLLRRLTFYEENSGLPIVFIGFVALLFNKGLNHALQHAPPSSG